jgi:signal transduction histidine kinase/CheY-like chemotaxis protein
MVARQLRVLLIEDDPTDALLVREVLREVAEVEIKCVGRLAPALEVLRTEGADVVLLDLGLPDSHGLESVRRVVEAAPDVPVIVHTGRAEESAGIEAVHAGAEDYLIKGHADGPSLMRTLRHGIERHESKTKMAHLVRVLRAVRNVNQLIVHERDSQRLIERACATLVETRGYSGAWISLEEDAGFPAHWAQAGRGEPFGPFARGLTGGPWPACRSMATESLDGLATLAESAVCEACPLRAQKGSGLCAVTMLRHTNHEFGMLGVAFSDSRAFDDAERGLLGELAGDLAFALSGLRTEEHLRREIADRERMEVELRHLQKLEAVGRLAAGIAHEINTPTQFVGDSLGFLKEAFDAMARLVPEYRAALELSTEAPVGGGSRREAIRALEEALDLEYLQGEIPLSLSRCVDGVSRIATIVQSMKEFARADRRDQSAADLNRAIAATIIVARNEYKFVANLETDFGELPLVMCHAGDLSQVFLNLIVNAAHAIADVVKDRGAKDSGAKGTIRITTRREGEQVRIDVADTGAGISIAARSHIFEPFFTTKPVGRGTGQGLAIARAIVVDRHGGSLTFESDVGQGTTFTIRLPIGGKANTSGPPGPRL